MVKLCGKVVLITGASSGIGKAAAELLKANGCKVYGTSRRPPAEGNSLNPSNGGFIKMLQMDVCSLESVKGAVDRVIEAEGRIDMLVNNAGMGIAGSVEDTSAEEAFAQLDTNFFGMHRVCRQVLPHMRKLGNGLIVNISSVAAQFAIPYQAMYSASKAAAEAVSEAMRTEVAPFGIKVVIVEPGDIKTGFTDSRKNTEASGEGSVYGERFKKSLAVMIRDETNGPEPIVIAKAILKLAEKKNPPLRKIVGFQYRLFVFLKRLIPSRLAAYIIARMY